MKLLIKRKPDYKKLLILLLLGILVCLVLLSISPYYKPIAGRDSTVFQYIGWKINQGYIPYRDVWDHKPPLIFYINALALRIFRNSSWGVWFFEWVNLYLTSIISIKLLRKSFGEFISITSTLLWLMCIPKLISEGNLTTEFALSFQFICVYIFFNNGKSYYEKLSYFIIGLFSGLSFLLKQNLIGIFICILITIALLKSHNNDWKKAGSEAFLVITGFLFITAVTILYFGLNGGLSDYWKDAFLYNFEYIKTDWQTRYLSIRRGFELFTTTGLSIFASIGWLVIFASTILRKSNKFASIFKINPFNTKIIYFVLLNLPIEIALATISGRTFPHYYIGWIPILTILTGFALNIIFRVLDACKLAQWKTKIFYLIIAFTIPVLILLTGYYSSFPPFLRLDNSGDENTTRIIKYIKQNTNEGDYVLILGAETGINFYSKRSSPTRYVYQYPLIKNNYGTSDMLLEFSDFIKEKKPIIIIDATMTNLAYTMGTGAGVLKMCITLLNIPINFEKILTLISKCHLEKMYDEWKLFLL